MAHIRSCYFRDGLLRVLAHEAPQLTAEARHKLRAGLLALPKYQVLHTYLCALAVVERLDTRKPALQWLLILVGLSPYDLSASGGRCVPSSR